MKKILYLTLSITYTLVIIMIFATLLTSNPYMQLSKGHYESHEDITFDHDYVSEQLIDYLNYRHDDLTFGYDAQDDEIAMSPTEIKHMEDVKDVYTMLRILAIISLIIVISITIIMAKKDKKWLYQTYKNIFYLPLAFFAFVGTWFLIDFNRIFTWFHELLFDNDDWLIPEYNVLIPLLPQNFWLVSGTIIVVLTAIVIGITVLFASKKLKTFS
ncbi:MAG: TIGR01906 family membrane protein [Candidatus Izemoplasmataceae bacterium]